MGYEYSRVGLVCVRDLASRTHTHACTNHLRMGVDFYPCEGGCGGTYTTCGEYVTCAVCYAGACKTCGESSWYRKKCADKRCDHRVETEKKDGTFFVCYNCTTVQVSYESAFEHLIGLYRALPGADVTLSYERIVEILSAGRESRYAEFKRENKQITESSSEADDDSSTESSSDIEDDNEGNGDEEASSTDSSSESDCVDQPGSKRRPGAPAEATESESKRLRPAEPSHP